MSKLSAQLDNEAVQALIQAKNSQRQLKNIGLESGEDAPLKSASNPAPVNEYNQAFTQEVNKEEPITPINIPTFQSPQPTVNTEVSYDTFIEVENLPSKGLFYRNKLIAQPLKTEDLLLIQSMDDFNVHSRFDDIFARRTRDVLPDEILSVDELYITMWLRATSFPGYDYPSNGFVCENTECDFQIKDPDYTVKFQQITWDANMSPEDVSEKFGEYGFIEKPLYSGLKVKITIPRRWHSKQVLDILEGDFYKNEKVPPQEYIDLLRLAVITDIGISDLRERANAISQFEAMDFLGLVKLINDNSFIVEPIVNHICPKCGEVTPLKGYPFRPEIYIPFDT